MSDLPDDAGRLEALVAAVERALGGDADAHADVSERGDRLDAVATGLNIVLEDLAFERRARARAESATELARGAYEHSAALHVLVEETSRVVLTCNDAFARRAGAERAAILERDVATLFMPTAVGVVSEALAKAARGEPSSFEAALLTEGRPAYVLGEARLIPGDSARLSIAMLDVTERRALEMQIAQAQRMEAVGRLAGGVAHDLNNLLLVIEVATTFVERDKGLSTGSREDLGRIHEASDRAAQLTRQLLSFARRQPTQPRDVLVNDVIKTVFDLLGRTLGEDIRCELVLSPTAGAVHIDPAQLERVLVNLATNARDAMPTGGSLTVETSCVDLDESYAREHLGAAPGRHVLIAVSDTGMGIPADILHQVFEPFFTTKPEGQGSGLGLATCYGVVRQAGGRILLYSEVGRGSTFKIYLPGVGAAAPKADKPDERPLARAEGERVLLIEDEPSVRLVTARILELAGFQVILARSGREALDLFDSEPLRLDLIITDVVMPGMSGRECADRLRTRGYQGPVLYISGFTSNAIVHHGVVDAGISFLPKPFTASQLVERAHDLLLLRKP